MAKRPTIKDNASRFRKTATVVITKELQKQAEELKIDLVKDISETLLNKYKENVELSYGPRGVRGREVEEYNNSKKELEQQDREVGIKSPRRGRKKLTYRHTNIFLDSIYTKYEGNTIKVMIEKREYPNEEGITKSVKTTEDIYNFLRYGTSGGGTYPYAKQTNPETGEEELVWAYNYPTPAHLFEEHTQNYMNSYIDSLKRDIKSGRYTRQKRR